MTENSGVDALTASEDSSRLSDSVVSRFLSTVAKYPENNAIVGRDTTLTYSDLGRLAEIAAVGLVNRGVRPGDMVGVSMIRSSDCVVTYLAVLLAGATYVPLNPADPDPWLRSLIDNAGLNFLVTDDATRSADWCMVVVDTNSLFGSDVVGRDANLPTVTAGEPAYVMHTSGTTGSPKGVVIPHRGIVRLVCDTDWLPVEPSDVVLHAAALEFDASTLEIYAAVLNGGCLAIIDTETLLIPSKLKQALHRAGVTGMFLTTPLFHQLIDEDAELFAGLRWLCVGGDALAERHARKFSRIHPKITFLNVYGPTENTVITTAYAIQGHETGPIPIGEPIRGTTISVLDSDFRLVAPGQTGELYTGGTGLADGYLNNSEETRRRFVSLGGQRMYRTGDLAHVDDRGVVHFHGRADHQVKIRGRRIEISAVNDAIRSIDCVRDVHTVAVAATAGKRLIAYVVLADGFATEAVTADMAVNHPDHMCPDVIHRLDHLPLKASGKVDQKRLPPIELTDHGGISRGNGLPLTPDQRKLAMIWADLLSIDLDALDSSSDFFGLGGTSITAGVLVGRVARELGGSLTLAKILEYRTLSSIEAIIHRDGGPATIAAAAIGPRPLLPQQRGIVSQWYSAPTSVAYNVPLRVDVSTSLTEDIVQNVLNQLIVRHDAFRALFATTVVDGRAEVVISFRERVELDIEVLDVRGLPSVPDEDMMSRFVRPFDLEKDVLLRAMLVHVDDDSSRIYLDSHHAVFDGVSLKILMSELFDLLDGRILAPAVTRYADAVAFGNTAAQLLIEKSNTDWWVNRLNASRVGPDLPLDMARPQVRSDRGAVLCTTVEPAVYPAMSVIASQLEVTTFALVVAAYVSALARINGPGSLTVGSLSSGRSHPDLHETVGMFVSTIPLQFDVTVDTSYVDLISQAAIEQRAALRHEQFSFERVVTQTKGSRDYSRSPLFDAFVAFQNIEFASWTAYSFDAAVRLLHPNTNRFDLNLQVYTHEDGLRLELEYSTALFTAASARSILDLVEAQLLRLVQNPNAFVVTSEVVNDVEETSSDMPDFAF